MMFGCTCLLVHRFRCSLSISWLLVLVGVVVVVVGVVVVVVVVVVEVVVVYVVVVVIAALVVVMVFDVVLVVVISGYTGGCLVDFGRGAVVFSVACAWVRAYTSVYLLFHNKPA